VPLFCYHLPKATCRHLDHNTHSVGDIGQSTELQPVFPCKHFRPDYLAPCATPAHCLQVSVSKTFKASCLRMARMVKEENGNNRIHTNHLHCEAHELPVQLWRETAHWGTLAVDCCLPQSNTSEYLATQNLTTPSSFFGNLQHLTCHRRAHKISKAWIPRYLLSKQLSAYTAPQSSHSQDATFDSGSYPVLIDNCCRACITNCAHAFCDLPCKTRSSLSSIDGPMGITLQGTLRWTFLDNQGQRHTF
jgi:hypothetical protein